MNNSTHIYNFNSIKVQLKPFSDGFTPAQPLFQFHKGTIKTLILYLEVAMILIFQFHKGTIKTCSKPRLLSLLLLYFNSIKVQLKPIVFGYIISLFSIEFANAKLRNLIEKMSMGNYIFLCVLRQPLFFMVLQQVKELNDA